MCSNIKWQSSTMENQLFLQQSNITKKVKAKILTFLSTCLLNGKVKVKVAHSCPALCNPIEYTVNGILQGRIHEWVAVPLSKGTSQPRDQTQVSPILLIVNYIGKEGTG